MDYFIIIVAIIYGFVCLLLGFLMGYMFSPNHKIKKIMDEIRGILEK